MSADDKSYLNSFINYELNHKIITGASFRLDRMTHLLNVMDNPQHQLKIIHVAGSKGKGSTCALVAHILNEAGYRVGLYTSPHIYHYRERIRILQSDSQDRQNLNRREIFSDTISEEEIKAILEIMKPAIQATEIHSELGFLSFFEVYTALALEYFRREKVNVVVLEAGLGGRLDATNAAASLLAVITPMSLEHTQFLGDTLEKIAQEKAAIIKNSKQRVVIAPQHDSARKVLKERSGQFQIKPVWIGEDVKYEMLSQDLNGQFCRIEGTKNIYDRIFSPLIGPHQSVNMAVALGVIETLQEEGLAIGQDAIYKGFKNVYWPGRLEVIQKNPLMILDGAHNDASAKVLVETLKDLFPERKVTVVLGLSSDKDKKAITKELNAIADKVIATKSHHPRAIEISVAELKQMFPGKLCWSTESVKQALDLIKKEIPADEVIVITGSLFVVSDVRKEIYVK